MSISHIEAGYSVKYKAPGEKRERTTKILPPCDEKESGHWYCHTHKEHFQNNSEASSHRDYEEGPHRMGWVCHLHGLEQP